MGPLRWANHPNHRGIIFRRERKRLQEIIDRTREIYPKILGPKAQWHETELRWKFPKGGSQHFGYAEHEKDVENYKSFEFNEIEFDELTEFTEHQYRFMLSRNRSKSVDLPLRIRAGTNPGGEGEAWVFRRFIENREPYKVYQHKVNVEGMGDLFLSRQFIPSTIFDNPDVKNREEYIAGLADLDPETREAVLYGRWGKFRGQFFPKAPKPVPPGYKTEEYGDFYVVRCMDYGWGDPTCVLWLVVYPKVKIVEIAHELYGPQMGVDSIAQMVKSIESDLRLGPGKIIDSVLSPDAFNAKGESGVAVATSLGERDVWFRRADNDRVNGWAQILKLLSRNQLHVWEGRAPNLMRTILTLPRNPNKSTDVKDKGVEDHAAESLRYGCMAVDAFLAGDLPRAAMPTEDRANTDQQYNQLIERLGQPQLLSVEGLGSGW